MIAGVQLAAMDHNARKESLIKKGKWFLGLRSHIRKSLNALQQRKSKQKSPTNFCVLLLKTLTIELAQSKRINKSEKDGFL